MSDSLERLYLAVIAAKDLDPATSRTARLFQRGPAKMAKKLAEEAVEVVIDAVTGDYQAVVRESADLLYNLTVLWVWSVWSPRMSGAKWSGASTCSELPRSCRKPPSKWPRKCTRLCRHGSDGDQLSRLRAAI